MKTKTKQRIAIKIIGKCGHKITVQDRSDSGIAYWQRLLKNDYCGKCLLNGYKKRLKTHEINFIE